MTKHLVNISLPERVARVVLGAVLAVVGVVLLVGGPGAWVVIGALVLIAVGIDFAVTGSTGYCPLYARLGHVARSLKGAQQ